MGAGHQRWWLSGSEESRRAEYSRKQRARALSYAFPRRDLFEPVEWFMMPWLPNNVVRIGAADVTFNGCQVCFAPVGEPCTASCDDDTVPDEQVLMFSKIGNPEAIEEPIVIDCGDRETAEAILAMMNAPPDPGRVELFRKTMKGGTVLLASTPAGPSTVFDGIEFVVDERLGPGEHYLFPKKVWRDAVNPNKESNVAKNKDGTMVIGKSFIDQIERVMGGLGVYSDTQFEERISTLLALEAKTDHENHLRAHQKVRASLEPKDFSVAARDAKPTVAGKVAIADGMVAEAAGRGRPISAADYMKVLETGEMPRGVIPTGPVGAAKKVYESLGTLGTERAKVGESYQFPVVMPVPETDGSLDYFDVAISSKDIWSIYRHPKCDGFVFDSDVTGQSVFIAYERLREMAKLFLMPREKTDRGEAMRQRILEAVGAASTLFKGKDGVFDSARAVEIAESLARDIELGPGLDSLPGIGRALELERNPEPEPLDHLDVDLLADDVKPGEG